MNCVVYPKFQQETRQKYNIKALLLIQVKKPEEWSLSVLKSEMYRLL